VIERECHCLMCEGPAGGNYWDARDRQTAQFVRDYGWNVTGVAADEQTPGWAYSIGLWHTLGSPEVVVFGLSIEPMMGMVNIVGDQIRDGQALQPDQRRAGVIEGFEVIVRPVHPDWYGDFFGAAIDFYQEPPLPIVQLVWPDKQGRYPWDTGAHAALFEQQPMLWLSKHDHPRGVWTDHDPTGGWPFGATLPYHTVHATQDVLDGAPIRKAARDQAGVWQFYGTPGGPLIETTMRQIVNRHPAVMQVADLAAGEHAMYTAAGHWQRDS
jgi:Domain of unknown function (DUF4262)